MKIVMFDLNNLAYRNFFAQIDKNKPIDSQFFDLWRYTVFSQILEQVHPDVSQVILAVDSTPTWRHKVYPRYKEKRKEKRETIADKQDIDFSEFFKEYDNLVELLGEWTPFHVLRIPFCEADDIIGCIALNTDNEITVVSSDEDYKQINMPPRVRVYDPYHGVFVPELDTERFVVETCLMGQKKDDIPNVKTPSDWGLTPETEGKRRPGFGPAACSKVMATGDPKGWVKEQGLWDNYVRNRMLMDFRLIPKPLVSFILKTWREYSPAPTHMLPSFFEKMLWPSLLSREEEVLDKLSGLTVSTKSTAAA